MDAFEKELERVFLNSFEALPRTMRRRVPTKEDSQDILQDACVQVLLHRKENIQNMNSYLWTTAKNLATNLTVASRRRRRLQETFGDLPEAVELTPARILESEQIVARLKKKVSRLAERERTAFELIAYRGLSYEEASLVMKCADRQVRRYFARALQQAHQVLNGG